LALRLVSNRRYEFILKASTQKARLQSVPFLVSLAFLHRHGVIIQLHVVFFENSFSELHFDINKAFLDGINYL